MTLNLADYDLILEGLFNMAADAPTERLEDRIQTAAARARAARAEVANIACNCEHLREQHAHTLTGSSTACRICHCAAFEPAAAGGTP